MLDPKHLEPGQEQFEEFYWQNQPRTPQNKRVQYDYRTPQGKLFSCVAMSLDKAREKRSAWMMQVAGAEN